MKGNIYTIRQGWYTLLVAAIITITPFFSSIANAQSCRGFRTQTQRDWGDKPKRNNAAGYMYANFATAFPNGLVVGCNNKLKLTSPQAISNLLPLNGRIGALRPGTLVDPNNRRFDNPFAGQVVALKLNLAFDALDANFSSNNIRLSTLVVRRGPFANKTVAEVMDEAEKALGGCTSARNIYQLNEIVTRINRNYMDGDLTGNYLSCPVIAVSPCANDTEAPVIVGCPTNVTMISPDPVCFNTFWAEPMATDNCTNPPALTSNYFSGECMPVGTTIVTYTTRDSTGNTSNCTFTVTVTYSPTIGGDALATKNEKLELDAQAEPRRTRLGWVSDMLVETDYFVLQKMDENGEFMDVETLNGATTPGLNFYSSYDESPAEGDNLYRIMSVLVDGSVRISATKLVNHNEINQIKVFPNPATEFIDVDLTNYIGKNVNIYLYNQMGQVERTFVIEEADAQPFHIEVVQLKSGNYFLRVSAQGKRDITKQISVAK